MRYVMPLLAAGALVGYAGAVAAAPLSYTGGTFTYTENFDSLGTASGSVAVPNGWIVGTNDPAVTTVTTRNVTPGDAYTQSAGRYNYGLASSPSDRSMGTQTSGSARQVLQLAITNNSQATLTSFTVKYDGEQWARFPSATAEPLRFRYLVGDYNPTDAPDDSGGGFVSVQSYWFTAPHFGTGTTALWLDGNDSANRVANIGGIVNLATPLAPGKTLFLNWTDEGNSQHHALALDNLVVTLVPEPASAVLLGGIMFLAGRRRKNLGA